MFLPPTVIGALSNDVTCTMNISRVDFQFKNGGKGANIFNNCPANRNLSIVYTKEHFCLLSNSNTNVTIWMIFHIHDDVTLYIICWTK